MAPLIDQELEHVDKKHAALTAVNVQLNSALNLYHSLMKESFAMMNTPYFGGVPQSYAGIPQFNAIASQPNTQMYSQANAVPNNMVNSMANNMPVQHMQQMPPHSSSYQMPYQPMPSQMHPPNSVMSGPTPQYVNATAGQPHNVPQQTFVPPIATPVVGVSQTEQYIQ